jgi:hypothetical protein
MTKSQLNSETYRCSVVGHDVSVKVLTVRLFGSPSGQHVIQVAPAQTMKGCTGVGECKIFKTEIEFTSQLPTGCPFHDKLNSVVQTRA